ncbi:MAG TPA: DNA polymerase III subunit chi [Chromatiales bacterium]|nr:DNA polymerase III subunit chi [Chromatiales bacterium]
MTDASTRIDFYILGAAGAGARERFACRLAEKAFGLGHRVHALTASAEQAHRLDELMWTFRAGSFVPHAIDSDAANADTPITIGFDDPAGAEGDLLINLPDEVPPCFDRFQRVAEIVDGSDAGKQAGRSRFRIYRDNGYPPDTHHIN